VELPPTVTTAADSAAVLDALWAELAAPAVKGTPIRAGRNLEWDQRTLPVVVRFLGASGPLPPILALGDDLARGAFLNAWGPASLAAATAADYRLTSPNPVRTGRGVVMVADPMQPMRYTPMTQQVVTAVAMTARVHVAAIAEALDQPGVPVRSLAREARDLRDLAARAEGRLPAIYAGWRDAYAAILADRQPAPTPSARTFQRTPVNLRIT
jgi:hypothetical protein